MSERVFTSQKLCIDKVGSTGGEAYLARTSKHALLYDSGFAHAAPAMIKELEELLSGRGLDFIFLSHSHYDHVSGSVWMKDRWPQASVVASPHTAYVLQRPGARKTILELNQKAALSEEACIGNQTNEASSFDFSPLEKLSVDQTITGGSIFEMGEINFEVLDAPGHTRCSLMLWCPEERLLFGSESLGVLVSRELVSPACLTGYQDALNTICLAQSLHPQHILANHRGVLSHEEAELFLKNAEYWTKKTAQLVWESADAGKSKEELLTLVKDLHFPEEVRAIQPEAAFDLNNEAMVNHLLSCKP